MSERSGVGLVEVTILEALPPPDQDYVKSARALRAVEDQIGLAPGYAYEVLVDLALPWKVPLTLIDPQGNYGSRQGDPPASARYTESRLTPAGQVVLSAEHGNLPPVPLGLINGNTHRDGTRPSFRPLAVIAAIHEVIRHPEITSQDIIDIIGLPDFMTGCTAAGDFAALAAGHPTDLQLHANVTISDDREVVIIENIPPNVSVNDVTQSIASRGELSARARQHPERYRRFQRASGLDLGYVDDATDRHHLHGRLICKPLGGTSPEALRDQLTGIYGVSTTMHVALPRPLPAMIRQWTDRHQDEDLQTSLTELETAILNQPNLAYY